MAIGLVGGLHSLSALLVIQVTVAVPPQLLRTALSQFEDSMDPAAG